jgi:pimeloyl-ACP methyl ester carboxylesterase
MPTLTRGALSVHYEVHGSGYPLVLFAPGGMRSSIPLWERSPFHPVRELADRFRVVAMDQRNAGRSRAPVMTSDGWHTYTSDHIALLDELGIERCHVLGQCIGSAFCLGLIAAAPERVTAAVLEQPIGHSPDNRGAFHEIFGSWADELVQARSDVTRDALDALENNLYGSDFVFSVAREAVRHCPVPLLVLRGNDVYHPSEISEEIARIAPQAELVSNWKEGDDVGRGLSRVRAFLEAHTPA